MRFFVDTHYVLWAALNSARIEPWAKDVIADLSNEVLVSAATVYRFAPQCSGQSRRLGGR